MKLSSGDHFGPYEIRGALGAGGMGEVFRARDTRLQRDVALKLLPQTFAVDRERVARFRREAQVLASLSHPHVAAIHGLEETNGTLALVLELVEGEGLDERLRGGAIAVDEALSLARQMAEGLEAAHEKGIVHRDLKPANIKITHDGVLKILDFGLAKAMDPDAAAADSADVSHSPTLSRHMTEAGLILGTAAYMSPEQARGRPVDKRSDVWAFGVVLYEMLTSRRLFAGETVSDTLAAVLRAELDWTALPSETPPSVRTLLRRCLERDPRQRLHDVADARIELQEAIARRGSELPPATAVPRSRVPQALLGAGLLLAGAAAGILAGRVGQTTGADEPGSFMMKRLTELPGPELHPDLSPDGRHLVYTSAAGGNRDVYLLRVGGDRALNLTADSRVDDEQAAISPDGESIAFRSARDGGGLFVMGLTGESVRRVTKGGFDPAWSPDGRRLAYATEAVDDPYARETISELWTVETANGQATRILAGDAVQPAWSPRGERIAYWANTAGQRDIWTVAAGGGAPVAVTQDAATDCSPEWSPDGEWLYFSSDRGGSMNLWRVRVDGATGKAAGEPEPVTSSVRNVVAARFSADGRRLTAMAYDRTTDLTLYEVSPDAPALRPLARLQPRSAHWCAPSPDATWLACVTTGTPEDLVLLRTDGSELRRLTSDAHKDRVPSWSPDGRRVAFYSTRGGQWDYWMIGTDGSGLQQLTRIGEANFGVWSPDGREMIIRAHYKDLWRIDTTRPLARDSARRLAPPAGAPIFEPVAWSSSGDRLAGGEYTDVRDYMPVAIGVWDLASGGYRRIGVAPAGPNFGAVAGWLPGGRRFIARTAEGCALIDADAGTWRVIAACEADDYIRATQDGRRMLVEREVLDADVWMLEWQHTSGAPAGR